MRLFAQYLKIVAIKAACFDFDCTIGDSYERGLKYLEEIIVGQNLPFTFEMRARIIAMWGAKPLDLIQALWPQGNCGLINELWHDDAKVVIPIVPGGFDALVKLASRYYLSMLTSRGRESLMRHVDSYKYLFKFFIAHDDIEFHKPDPRSIEAVIEEYKKYGVKREEIIYIGDTPSVDWPPARECGIEFFGVTTGPNKREAFLEAGLDDAHVLNSIADLPDILERRR